MSNESSYIHFIKNQSFHANLDNITRTNAYLNFYKDYPEIRWAFLASMVSRNAGWNMTDLKTPMFEAILNTKTRKRLFSTYERANWLIFSDAYPQLLLYKKSCELDRPLFHLLPHFSVSTFMQKEWKFFWQKKDKTRLVTALIINEQNVIQRPVVQHPFYKYRVFLKWPYLFQDFFHMSAVLFPMRDGNIFALDVHDFFNINRRITLGKKLATTLFQEQLYNKFYDFAVHTEHTGSREDYEQYLQKKSLLKSPTLRSVYPIIEHQDNIRYDWFIIEGFRKKWWKNKHVLNKNVWKKFDRKRRAFQVVTSWYKKELS